MNPSGELFAIDSGLSIKSIPLKRTRYEKRSKKHEITAADIL
jgi:hypothetical protein